MAQEGIVLTESQLAAMERAREEKEAHGETETEHPGYLGAQDTYYTLRALGTLTFIDTYTKVRSYDRKNALVAADALNSQVIPFFDSHGIPLLRVLTDRGSEYCGNREHHEYALYLDLENIEHSMKTSHGRITMVLGHLNPEPNQHPHFVGMLVSI